ncbi:MAG TPA: glycosyltransferase family 4 protein [Chiayiivirga sp.]|nr:glycosyltransferase family 4 protein [Chiayiivirga sp.]
MRVLMFCPQFAPLIGGAERQAEKLGMALRTAGVDVRVLTPRLDAESPAHEVRAGLPVRRFRLSDLSARFPRLRGIGLVNAPWIALQILWQVWREAGNVDVVHCHIGSLQTVAAALAARLRGVPAICKAAIADDRSDLGEAARAGITGKVVAWAGKHAFARWVATTQAVKVALQRAGVAAERIIVIPNGVDIVPMPAPMSAKAARRFLYLGRLSTNIERDVPGLIRAFDALADQVADVELAIVGDGDLLNTTRTQVTQCRHADRIQVPGIGNSAAWLAWADCFVLPSRREGLSNALLEAMAAGLPCIANDIPPNREVLADGEAGMLVPVEDVGQLQAAMLKCAMDAEHAAQMTRAAYDRIECWYGMNRVVRQYLFLYRPLFSKSSAL